MSEKLYLDHKSFVVNGDYKCVVCWTWIGKHKLNNRCSNCQDYNRLSCDNCIINAIKVHINYKKNIMLCEYCNGDLKRINDRKYSYSHDYKSKFKLIKTQDLYGKKIIIPNKFYICEECYISDKYKLSKEKHKCMLCDKYKSSYYVDKKYFINLKNMCKICNIYSEKDKCNKCKIEIIQKIIIDYLKINEQIKL